MKVYSATDIGQIRKMNQDFIFVSSEPVGNLPNLFVVADGMGGHNAGDYASRYGVGVLTETIREDHNFNPVRIMRAGIEAANKAVLAKSQSDPELKGMGSTMVVATVVGGYLFVANVGDSRLYLAGEAFRQITHDHSLIAEMVRLGELTPEEGMNHPDRNIITRAIGTTEEVKIDFFDVKLENGDCFMMCSDGLYNMVEGSVIYKVLCDHEVKDKAEKLVELANAGGGLDNIAVVVVEPYTADEPLPEDAGLNADTQPAADTEDAQPAADAAEEGTAADHDSGESVEQETPVSSDPGNKGENADEAAAGEDTAEETDDDQAGPETGRN
ncbi:MAG: Stp1/IreP family PP2C-type Ser/Thr phosphatase [Eubacterium sp.]|nr:Stp1/IreP family PP2C-type Ser/Thr phosphatase [Eubacterium sp.]